MSEDVRTFLRACFDQAVRAADPEAAVARSLREDPLDLDRVRRLVVVGAGKATAPMAAAAEAALGDRLSAGAIVVKHGHGLPLTRIAVHEAGHPVPDEGGLRGTAALLKLVEGLAADDLVLALISGGASALLPAPAGALTFVDEQATNRALLASGAPIQVMNALRKHISAIKGGQLARRAMPARLVACILSDVIGDDLSVIASGPTVADPSTYAGVLADVERYAIALPPSVRAHLEAGAAGRIAETPKPGDPCFARVENRLVGSNAASLRAIAEHARAAGYAVDLQDEPITGEVTACAEAFCTRLRAARPRTLVLAGGEPTVTLGANPGRGGRAQAFALAAARLLAGATGCGVLAAGTDGSDGPTDAAGGFADGTSTARAQAAGIDLTDHERRQDAYPALQGLGDLLITGPTRTNVMDVYLGLAE